MAINPETLYVGKIAPSSADYPYGQARNITTPSDGTGTPWEAALVNDIFGFQQALLDEASIVPSGNPDTVPVSQYLQAIKKIIVSIVKNTYISSSYTTLAEILTAIGSTKSTLILDSSLPSANQTIPGNIDVKVFGDGIFTGTGTLIVTNHIKAQPKKIFDSNLAVSPSTNDQTGRPEWFGAVGDGLTDDTTPLQKCVDAFAIVKGTATYLVQGTIAPSNNIELVNLKIVTNASFSGTIHSYTYYDQGLKSNTPLTYFKPGQKVILNNCNISAQGFPSNTAEISLCIFDACNLVEIIAGEYSTNRGTNLTLAGGALFFLDCVRSDIEKVYIHDTNGAGIHSRSDFLNIKNCRFENGENLFLSQRRNSADQETKNNNIQNSHFDVATNFAISINSNDSIISGNTINNSAGGINLGIRDTFLSRSSASDSLCIMNIINNANKGIQHNYGQDITIANNKMKQIGLGTTDDNNAAIYCSFWAGDAQINNNIIKNSLAGITIEGYSTDIDETVSAQFLINANKIKQIQRYAILSRNALKLTINANQLHQFNLENPASPRAAIYIRSDSNPQNYDALITENLIGRLDLYPLDNTGLQIANGIKSNTIILDNNIFNNTDDIDATDAHFITFGDNKFRTGGIDRRRYKVISESPAGTIDIARSKYISLNFSTLVNINTINHQLQIGDILTIGTLNSNATLVQDTGNLRMNNGFIMKLNDGINFVFDGTFFVEIGRGDN